MKEALHRAMHRIPGVPAHVDRPAGHQGRALRNRPFKSRHHEGRRHKGHQIRRPRVLVAWQRRIGRFFGQELP